VNYPALFEVEKNLGSSPDGLSQVKAQKQLNEYGLSELAEKNQCSPEIFQVFLGSHPLDDRGGGNSLWWNSWP